MTIQLGSGFGTKVNRTINFLEFISEISDIDHNNQIVHSKLCVPTYFRNGPYLIALVLFLSVAVFFVGAFRMRHSQESVCSPFSMFCTFIMLTEIRKNTIHFAQLISLCPIHILSCFNVWIMQLYTDYDFDVITYSFCFWPRFVCVCV